MSQPDLPLEIVETIIDLLRNEPEALRQCSQASKLFALLTRKYTFGDIELLSPLDLRKWEETFPEPANSPACYTRSLTVGLIEVGTTEDVDKGCWIRSFTKVRRLFVRSERCWEFGPNGSYPPFDALSSVTSLKLHSTHLRPQQNFELICSFPLLEDLDIEHCEKSFGEIDGCRDSIQRLGRPKLTGTLFLRDLDLRHTIDLLLALPGGLHFRKIALDRYIPEQFRELAALMEKCYGTLECIDIGGRLISGRSSPLGPATGPVSDVDFCLHQHRLLKTHERQADLIFLKRQNSKKLHSGSSHLFPCGSLRYSKRSPLNMRPSNRFQSTVINFLQYPPMEQRPCVRPKKSGRFLIAFLIDSASRAIVA